MVARAHTLLAIAAGLVVTGALAAEPAATDQSERQVCRAPAKTLGSRIRTPRRCRTEAQWKEEEDRPGGLPISAQVTTGQNDGHTVRQPN
jgi:hypothetical protein